MKKIVIACLIFIILFTNFILSLKTPENEVQNKTKEIKVVASKRFNSRLYSVVINDVTNDYSYHDYTEVNTYYYESFFSKDVDNVDFEFNEKQDNDIDNLIDESNEEIELANSYDAEEEIKNDEIVDDNFEINEENIETEKVNVINDEKNGFYEEDNKMIDVNQIDEKKHYFSPSGKYLGTENIKIIDVSFYQGDINWDEFVLEGDFFGVILRLGYYTFPDKKFDEYIDNIKRLNIPYGIYLFSYAASTSGALKEAHFTNNMIDKYDLNPTLGIYYDIESWSSKTSSSDEISNELYSEIIEIYINEVSNHVLNKYKVKVYSNRWYAMNRLNEAKKYVDWVAEYNSSCQYDADYSMWQYTSSGTAPGINGYVDISYLLT